MIVLDTNILTELLEIRRPSDISGWLKSLRRGDLFTTAINQAEMLYGIAILPKGRRREDYFATAHAIFREDFEGRILPFDTLAAEHYANIVGARKLEGRPMQPMDAQVAAIARSRGMVLATRNVRDFEGCEVELIDPWSVQEE